LLKEEIIMIKDKIVVVTGAGSGLGRELAIKFTTAGARVIGFGRNVDKLKETSSLIENSLFEYFCVDVTCYEQVKEACDEIIQKHSRIDILFNNAAVYPKVNFLQESPEDWAQAININITGVANCCKVILPVMIKHNSGRIFNIGSWADLAPISNSAAYSCSKGAIHALTKAIYADIEHLNLNIEIHEWIPGHLKTQMSEFTGIEPSIAAQWGLDIANRASTPFKSSIFTNNHEWHPPKSIKQKLKSLILFWKE
jgi:NADP-dependent 3-hydroxy acid dehydrogenase YdfG